MSRQFGLSRRPIDAGNIQRGGAPRANTHPNTDSVPTVLGISSLRSVNSGGEIRQPFIDAREIATGCFLCGFAALVALLLFVGFVGYRTLIA